MRTIPLLLLALALPHASCTGPGGAAAGRPVETPPEVEAGRYRGIFREDGVHRTGEPAPDPWLAGAPTARTVAPAAYPPVPVHRDDDADDVLLERRLSSATVRGLVVENEESLRAVVGRLRAITGLPFVVHPAAENAALDGGAVFDLRIEHAITVRNLLNLIAGQAGDDVTWVVRHETVLFTTKEKSRKIVLGMHSVQTLVAGRTDFLAPRIDRLRLLDELEDDDGGGPFGGVGEVVRAMDEDSIVGLIQENVAPGTWEDDGVSIEAHEGTIFILHTPEVQREVRRFLARLGS